MTRTLFATYDGKHLLIEEPLQLPPNIRVKIIVELEELAETPTQKDNDFPVIHVKQWPENLSLNRKDMYGDNGR